MNQLIDMPDYAFFKMTELQSIMCTNCNKESSFNVEVPLISLNVNAGQSQSVAGLLSRDFDSQCFQLVNDYAGAASMNNSYDQIDKDQQWVDAAA